MNTVYLALALVAFALLTLLVPAAWRRCIINRQIREIVRAEIQATVSLQGRDEAVTVLTYGDATFTTSLALLRAELRPYMAAGMVKELQVARPADLAADAAFTLQQYIPDLNPGARKVYKRGGGYWLWKPFLVHRALQHMREGDILMYTDAGCVVSPLAEGRASWRGMVQRVMESPSGIVAVELEAKHRLRRWVPRAVREELGVTASAAVMEAPMIAAGHFWIRKTAVSTGIVERWWRLARDKPQLFLDVTKRERRHEDPAFQESRHDQSVWSLLLHSGLKQDELQRSVVPLGPYEDVKGRAGPWYLRFSRRRCGFH